MNLEGLEVELTAFFIHKSFFSPFLNHRQQLVVQDPPQNNPSTRFGNPHRRQTEHPELTEGILHDLASGFRPIEVSAEYNCPYATVWGWQKKRENIWMESTKCKNNGMESDLHR